MAVTRAITLKTEIPGPKSRALLERKARVVAAPLATQLPVFAAETSGSTVTDVDGNTFIDFTGGVGVLNVGHSHPEVIQAVQEQAGRFMHTDFTVIPYEGYVEAGRAAARPVALPRAREGGLLQRRHGGRRERGQVRTRATRAAPASSASRAASTAGRCCR